MSMQHGPFPFSGALLALGVMLGGLVVADLAVRGLERYPVPPAWQVAGGDPAQGRQAIRQYGCGGCHTIPGVRGAKARVGPKLDDFRRQSYIGGQLANVPENLVLWIQNPQQFAPGTAMPNLHVTEAEARDIAAYLYASD